MIGPHSKIQQAYDDNLQSNIMSRETVSQEILHISHVILLFFLDMKRLQKVFFLIGVNGIASNIRTLILRILFKTNLIGFITSSEGIGIHI